MKKSEALNILGLVDGATDDEIKQAHRKLVIAHHPDKFALDSKEHAEAEEKTKRLNEARDVLLNRAWTPEFDPRRDGGPYANPYVNPYGQPRPGTTQGQGAPGDPFVGWPFGQGQTTYVWTSWDDVVNPGSATGNPFDPFGAAVPKKTPQEILAETARDLKSEILVVVVKILVLAAAIVFNALAAGLFFYVMASLIYGLWKRLGSCLIGLIIPLSLVAAPFIMLLSPREGGVVTAGLGLAFAISVLFDITNLRDRIRGYRQAKQNTA